MYVQGSTENQFTEWTTCRNITVTITVTITICISLLGLNRKMLLFAISVEFYTD